MKVQCKKFCHGSFCHLHTDQAPEEEEKLEPQKKLVPLAIAKEHKALKANYDTIKDTLFRIGNALESTEESVSSFLNTYGMLAEVRRNIMELQEKNYSQDVFLWYVRKFLYDEQEITVLFSEIVIDYTNFAESIAKARAEEEQNINEVLKQIERNAQGNAEEEISQLKSQLQRGFQRVAYVIQSYKNCTAQKSQLKTQLEKCQKGTQMVQNQNELQRKIEVQAQRIRELESLNKQCKADNQVVGKNFKRAQELFNDVKAKSAQCNSQNMKCEANSIALLRDNVSLRRQIKRQREKNLRLALDIKARLERDKAKSEQIQKQIDNSKGDSKKLERMLRDTFDLLEECQKVRNECNAELKETQEQNELLEIQIEAVSSENDATKMSYKKLTKSLKEEIEQKEQYAIYLIEEWEKQQQLEQKYQELSGKFETTVADLESKKATMQDMKEQYERDLEHAQSELRVERQSYKDSIEAVKRELKAARVEVKHGDEQTELRIKELQLTIKNLREERDKDVQAAKERVQEEKLKCAEMLSKMETEVQSAKLSVKSLDQERSECLKELQSSKNRITALENESRRKNADLNRTKDSLQFMMEENKLNMDRMKSLLKENAELAKNVAKQSEKLGASRLLVIKQPSVSRPPPKLDEEEKKELKEALEVKNLVSEVDAFLDDW